MSHTDPMPGATQADFRSDINGLRAWAVVAVILYHFGLPGFAGGFAGVDVFFVISGYLMTRIVVHGLEAGSFTLTDFYIARARRILPGLLALCLAVLALGWYMLTSVDLMALGKHVAASLLFISNIQFWREAGYFDVESHNKWLLHTWSLSVEWQFYLVLPLVLMAVWKFKPGRPAQRRVVLAWMILSLLLSIWLTTSKPNAAFYLLPPRAWEMLAGGMVALLPPLKAAQARWMPWLGMSLIVTAMMVFSQTLPWPSAWALVPVVGTALTIAAARPGFPWTAHAAAQWLGTRSYSLYLWHWPVVSGLHYLEMQSQPTAIAAGLGVTLLAGWASYALIEHRARITLSALGWRSALAAMLVPGVLLVTAGQWMLQHAGFPARNPSDVEAAAQMSLRNPAQVKKCMTFKGPPRTPCLHGGQQVRAVLLGDSHANAIAASVVAALPDKSGGLLEWTYAGCPSVEGAKAAPGSALVDHQCAEFNKWALQRLSSVPQDIPVILISRASSYVMGYNEAGERLTGQPLVLFPGMRDLSTEMFQQEYARRLTDFACQIARHRRVYWVRPLPEMKVDVPRVLSRRLMSAHVLGQDHADISIALSEYRQRHRLVWAAQDDAARACGLTLLNPLEQLCNAQRCRGSVGPHALYFDDDHLSDAGNALLAPLFRKVFTAPPTTAHAP